MGYDDFKKMVERKRQERNRDIVRDVKAGTYNASFDSTASWFPDRPLIKKDKEAIKRLYGCKDETSDKTPNK